MKFWPFGRKQQKVAAAPCTELPVPTHLKPFFLQQSDDGNDAKVIGDIRCICGSKAFAAHHSKDDDCLYHLTCDDCRKDILLFDAQRHGWDTIVCHMPGENLHLGDVTAICEKCGSERFSVSVWIEPTEKGEFISCVEGELSEDEWVNAFTWFAAHLTCTNCGCKQRDWADIETA